MTSKAIFFRIKKTGCDLKPLMESCRNEQFEVEDRGQGVAEDDLKRVFEPFFSTKTDRGGTGMGLAITRDMITNLGGEVSLENLASGGARATVRLKRWKESEASS